MTFSETSEDFVKLEKPTFFHSLRWKITVAFIVLFFGLLAVLGPLGAVIEYAFLSESFIKSGVGDSDFLIDSSLMRIENGLAGDHKNLQKNSAELLQWLDSQPRNSDAIRIWLKRYDENLKVRRKNAYPSYYLFPADDTQGNAAINPKTRVFQFIVFDDKLDAIASADSDASAASENVEAKELADAMLKENANPKRKFDDGNVPQLQFAFPISDGEDRLKGILYFKEILPFDRWDVLRNGLSSLTDQVVSNLIFFTIVGFAFSLPFAWYLSRRLQKIAFAAQSWRTGDFSARTNDKHADEIGILSRNLNEMANDLSETFALRQKIATVEERNRIARDLHDSVKQQVFGLAMQISTASALVEKNPESAKNYLLESENLIKEIQAELVDMIGEFSLPADETETFKTRLESFIADWTRQNVIRTETNIADDLKISPAIAQTFYRITQATLANVARHSEATEVKISVKNTDGKLAMKVADNGCGFDVGKAKKGFGLQSIRARAEKLPKGWIKIESKPNDGATIEFGCEATN